MAVALLLQGRADYAATHALQAELVARRARDEIDDVLLLLEHAEVITLGRKKGAEQSLVAPGSVPVVEVERGGDATWHGPGQLVAYPIVKLEGGRADLHLHLHSLEDAVTALLARWGLAGQRDERNTGVWLPAPEGPPQKVCSIGIACRRWVTWHGLALNLDVDLARFGIIQPCGFDASVMTRVADHLSPCPSLGDAMTQLIPPLVTALELPELRAIHTVPANLSADNAAELATVG